MKPPVPLSPAASLRHVGVKYQTRNRFSGANVRWALKDISFDVLHGETLGILGRNGAGKSTLLRLLAGIIGPDRGKIVTDGSRATLLSLQVGFLAHLTGRENAVLSGILLGMSRREVEARLDEIIAFSELGELIDEPLSTYSSGMRARLGFSVAFQANPDILLVDEVLGVGDLEFRQKSSNKMRELMRSDKTVVLVSHSPATLRELCDRLVWIQDGRSVAAGPVDEILAAYQAAIPATPPSQQAATHSLPARPAHHHPNKARNKG